MDERDHTTHTLASVVPMVAAGLLGVAALLMDVTPIPSYLVRRPGRRFTAGPLAAVIFLSAVVFTLWWGWHRTLTARCPTCKRTLRRERADERFGYFPCHRCGTMWRSTFGAQRGRHPPLGRGGDTDR